SGASSNALQGMWLDVVVRSTGASACTGHMWLYRDAAWIHDFVKGFAGEAVADGGGRVGYSLQNGDDQYTTTIPATANNVIAVGSYMPPRPAGAATSTWTADDGSTYDQSVVGDPNATGSATDGLSLFSSLGPTADGRKKPDIVAPGEPIVSTKARNPGPYYGSDVTLQTSWVKMEGTSMASPHAAGIVALLLQKNHALTVAEARTALRAGASTAGMTALTADPENSYGAGKVDAVAAMNSVADNTSSYTGTGDLERGSNGGGGSTSCAFAADAKPRVMAAAASFAFGILLISIARLRRRRREMI
nr:S8 family serine peptidase [bacterium]